MNAENWQDPTKVAFTCIILLKEKNREKCAKINGVQ